MTISRLKRIDPLAPGTEPLLEEYSFQALLYHYRSEFLTVSAHSACHTHTGHYTCRIWWSTQWTGALAVVLTVRLVGMAYTTESMTFYNALKTFTFAGTDYIHKVAFNKEVNCRAHRPDFCFLWNDETQPLYVLGSFTPKCPFIAPDVCFSFFSSNDNWRAVCIRLFHWFYLRNHARTRLNNCAWQICHWHRRSLVIPIFYQLILTFYLLFVTCFVLICV